MPSEQERLYAAVDAFADAMKAKLMQKHLQGKCGWRKEQYICGHENMMQIAQHFGRLVNGSPQEIDLANLLMFRWHFCTHLPQQEAAEAAKGDSDAD